MLPNRVTRLELIKLYMVDFDVFFGMDLLYASFVSIDYKMRVVKFNFLNELFLQCKGGNSIPRGRIIYCLKAGKMIS